MANGRFGQPFTEDARKQYWTSILKSSASIISPPGIWIQEKYNFARIPWLILIIFSGRDVVRKNPPRRALWISIFGNKPFLANCRSWYRKMTLFRLKPP
jgi:hypothetical protein